MFSFSTNAGMSRTPACCAWLNAVSVLGSEFSKSVSSAIQRQAWVFKATLYKRNAPRGFVGFGDADPSNVSALVRGAEMRVAETRAVNRALRKAYGIGLSSVEELGWASRLPKEPVRDRGKQNNPHTSNGSNNG